MVRWIVDAHHALRGLLRTPRLALAAMVCIAIGIAATVATATLVHGALLRDLPYPQSERMVRLWTSVSDGNRRSGLSIPDFEDVAREASAFDRIAAVGRLRFVFLGDLPAERMRGEAVSTDFFDLTGVQPQLGRRFNAEEMQRNGPAAILIAAHIWRSRFGADPDLIGQTVRVGAIQPAPDDASGDSVFTVIGVMPDGFRGTVEDDTVDFWVPFHRYGSTALRENRAVRTLWTLARLGPGVARDDAVRQLERVSESLADAHPASHAGARLWLEPVGESWREGLRGGLYALLGGAVLLLAVACLNIASLLLARAADRRRELALRGAVGADRSRLLRLLFLESLLLAIGGGVVGVTLSFVIVAQFMRHAAVYQPGWLDVSVDPVLLLVAAATVLATALACGLAPALIASRSAPLDGLRGGGRGLVASGAGSRTLRGLMATQIALTTALLVGAGLLLRSYGNLLSADLGFRSDAILRLAISLDRRDAADADAQRRFYDALAADLRSAPGVLGAGLISVTAPPWAGFRPALRHVPRNGVEPEELQVRAHGVEPGLFDTLDIPLLRGRMFGIDDGPEAPPVALVSAGLAERLAAGGDVLERRFEIGGVEHRVIGVVADVRFESPLPPAASQWRSEPRPDFDVYRPLRQFPMSTVSVVVHGAVPPESLIEPLSRRIQALAPRSAVHWVSTMQEELSDRYAEPRFHFALLGGFALASLLLAGVGLHALLANHVARRRGEIGLRMALGASRGRVMRQVTGSGFALCAGGAAIGLLIGMVGAHALSGLLHEVAATDAAVYAGSVLFLVAVAGVAALLPARRAASVPPADALRAE